MVAGLSGRRPPTGVEVKAAAERDGIKLRTLDRAKAALGIKPTREGYASGGRWVWPPPLHSAPTPPFVRQSGGVAHNGDLGAQSRGDAPEEGNL